jgi:hypothetical protein
MTVLRLADVIVPEVFARYITEDSVKLTTLYRSGILAPLDILNQFLAGGGTIVNVPFWQRLTGNAQAIQTNYTITTDKTTTSKQVARRMLFANGWSAEELASALSGENAMQAITAMVDQWWDEQLQLALLAVVRGIIDDNEDNDSADLVNDISTSATVSASNKISSDAVIDTFAKKGDMSNFKVIAMHSVPYFKLVKDNIITFEPESEQDIGFGTYLGMTVIVNDQIYKEDQGSNKQYWTILFEPGAFGWGESAQGITVVETDRTANKSEDLLFTRRQFSIHPRGWKWIENSVTGDMPTMTELTYAGNWDRVFEKKNTGIAVLKTNG